MIFGDLCCLSSQFQSTDMEQNPSGENVDGTGSDVVEGGTEEQRGVRDDGGEREQVGEGSEENRKVSILHSDIYYIYSVKLPLIALPPPTSATHPGTILLQPPSHQTE